MSLKNRIQRFALEAPTKYPLTNISQDFDSGYRNLFLWRRALELIGSILLIFGGQQFVIQNAFFGTLWPAYGVALAAIFLRGPFILIGIFLGSFASYQYNHGEVGFSLLQSLLFTSAIGLTWYSCIKWVGPIVPLANVRILLKFLSITSGVSVGQLIIFGWQLREMVGFSLNQMQYLCIILAQLNSVICLTTLCLIFEPFAPQHYFRLGAWKWWVPSIVLISSYFFLFFVPFSFAWLGSIILGSLLMGYAYYFGQIPTALTLLGISVVYLGGVKPYPHFFQDSFTLQQSVLLLCLFTSTSLLSLSLATFIQQKRLGSSSKLGIF